MNVVRPAGRRAQGGGGDTKRAGHSAGDRGGPWPHGWRGAEHHLLLGDKRWQTTPRSSPSLRVECCAGSTPPQWASAGRFDRARSYVTSTGSARTRAEFANRGLQWANR